MVRDAYPQGIQPTSQDSIALGTLMPDESRQVIFSGIADEPGTYENVAYAVADDVAEVSARCTVTIVQCRLEMELVGPEDIYYGDSANFTVRVTNVGDGQAEAGFSLFVNVRNYCQRRLSKLPPEGLRAYRARVDGDAEHWYRLGAERRDPELLRRVVERSFCSSWGDDALELLGDLSFQEGHFAEALAAYRGLVPDEAGRGPIAPTSIEKS